ncbi:MAG: glycosyltransferase [Gemmatimonadales bacterium]|nr:glycosyltransferase [Gemmatimonadales bacterium]
MANPTVPELAAAGTRTPKPVDGCRHPSVGLVAFAPLAWGTAWTSRNHVTMSLGRSVRAVWLSPAPEWRRARPWKRVPADQLGPVPPIPGFSVDHPRWHEVTAYRPAAFADALLRRRLRRVAASLRRGGCTRLIAYLWRSSYFRQSRLIPFDQTVIHLDDEHSFSEREQPVSEREAEALAAADLVFLSSPRLVERKGRFNERSYLFPNGVDLAWYREHARIPDDLAAIPEPRLGYTGFLRKMLDWPLLLELARRRPAWQFVFVGGQAGHELPDEAERLRALPNAHFLGYRQSPEMVAYQQHFDVALLPYAVNAYTNCIFPVKLHEYLAAGAPTVGTPIRSLVDFRSVIEVADGIDDWEAAIERLLVPGQRDAARTATRRATAGRYDWDRMADAAAELMLSRLGLARDRGSR